MKESFLGSGWDFFKLTLTEKAGVERSAEDESIRQAIWIILGTAPGERIMRPDFGCRLHELVFAVPTTAVLGQIAAEIRHALAMWEPRVDVLDVRAGFTPDAPDGEIRVEISYRTRRTNNLFNLVYPFYLDRSVG